jgi:hypothetical protein
MSRMKRLAVAFLLFATAAGAQTISWIKYDPSAIRSDRTAPATIELVTAGSVTGVRLDFAAGGSLTLTPTAPNHWSGSVPAAQLLAGYDASDVNHNVVGFVRLLAGATTAVSYNSVINVVDGRVPAPPIRQLDATARATPRIVNLHRPFITASEVQSAVQQFYTYYRDDFDFVQVVFALPSYPANRYHFMVRNDVQGIGAALSNNSAAYGSAGKLKGITVYPIDTFFDLGESAFSHELGHQWINFLKNPSLAAGSPHWPPSTMARGIMGLSIPGSGAGGDFPYRIELVNGTTAHVTLSVVTQEFSDLDLYLMGFLPPASVAPGIVIQGSGCTDCTVAASQVTIADVIAANGARLPGSTTSQKAFRIANVVISRDRLLNDEELAVLDYFAARGEATEILPYTSGLARGTTKPFYLATRRLGTVDFRLELPPPRRRAAKH